MWPPNSRIWALTFVAAAKADLQPISSTPVAMKLTITNDLSGIYPRWIDRKTRDACSHTASLTCPEFLSCMRAQVLRNRQNRCSITSYAAVKLHAYTSSGWLHTVPYRNSYYPCFCSCTGCFADTAVFSARVSSSQSCCYCPACTYQQKAWSWPLDEIPEANCIMLMHAAWRQQLTKQLASCFESRHEPT